jgi:MoaA/NifB/PqqE/SkfB family radical SAM enzyme
MITELKTQGYNIILNGTEPLIFDGFIELFKLADQNQVFTNGKVVLENPDIVNTILKNGIKQISFSYHYGVQDDWSEVSLADVEKAIDICIKAGLEVCVLCSLCSKNYTKVLEICKKVKSLGVKQIHFTNFICQGRAKQNNMQHYILTEEQILAALKDINLAREKYDIADFRISRCGSFGNAINSKNFLCDAGVEDFVIAPDNKVYPCLFFTGISEYQIGEYKDGKINIFKQCSYDCKDCFAKKILNQNKQINIFK